MTYEKAAEAAYLVWLAKDSVKAKRLSDFFSRLPPCAELNMVEAAYLKNVLEEK
jgi:hypothetical protein